MICMAHEYQEHTDQCRLLSHGARFRKFSLLRFDFWASAMGKARP